jgi:site-specific DNA recombinase
MPAKGIDTAILYAAKSSPDEGGSIPGQLTRGRKFAADIGSEVVAEYYEENVSAYRGDRGRELAAAMDHAERIGACLIVLHSDRLARGDGKKARHLVEIALWAFKAEVTIHSIEDPATFENLIMAAVMGERNTEDSRRKGSAVREGLERRRAEGGRVGGNSYALTWRRNEKDERETIPDPDKAPVVVRIYDEYLDGRNQLQIVKALNTDGIKAARGGKWSPTTVRSVLMNPLYAGLVRDGDKLIEAKHEAIVPRERWEEAQRLRVGKERTHRRGRDPVGQHLFRKGFLRCGDCGAGMTPRTGRNKDGSLYEIYRCHGRYTDPANCSMPHLRRELIDSAVFSYFEQVGLDLEATRADLDAAIEHRRAEVMGLLKQAEREAAAAAARLARIKSDYVAEDLTASEWRELRAELEPEAEAAEMERSRLSTQLAEIESGPAIANLETELLERLAKIRAALAGEVNDASGTATVRAALLRLFDGFVLRHGTPENAHVELIGGDYWIEPLVREDAVQGYDEALEPVLGWPADSAENNCHESLVRL